jgi:hypothetical protein
MPICASIWKGVWTCPSAVPCCTPMASNSHSSSGAEIKAAFDYGGQRDLIRALRRSDLPLLLTIAASHGDILRLP